MRLLLLLLVACPGSKDPGDKLSGDSGDSSTAVPGPEFSASLRNPDDSRIRLVQILQIEVDEAVTVSVQVGNDLLTPHTLEGEGSGVFDIPEAHLDMVRPGMALYGGYPNDPHEQRLKGTLRCTVRLKARVVRVERLRAGDSVSYGRNYIADKPTWVATIPVGHTDGYPRRAVEGARVLIGARTYPAIGAVSASHTIVEVGSEDEGDDFAAGLAGEFDCGRDGFEGGLLQHSVTSFGDDYDVVGHVRGGLEGLGLGP